MRLDVAEYSQGVQDGEDLGTSLIVYHDPGTASVPGQEVDSGIVGWNEQLNAPVLSCWPSELHTTDWALGR